MHGGGGQVTLEEEEVQDWANQQGEGWAKNLGRLVRLEEIFNSRHDPVLNKHNRTIKRKY